MILSMKAQGLIFAFVCLLGFGFGFLYDFIRLFEGIFERLPLVRSAADFIYWVFASAAVFYFLLGINYGEVRLYMVLGFMGGMTCYYLTLSSSVMNVFAAVLKVVKKGLIRILKPFYIIGNILKLWLKKTLSRVL
ncbi:MAG: spore cortex biosynthesis protein YabQ, partial [Clostridiales bacterium]|nr:spore cortex biosynthesis protein YabQ [Clostridiales bacterium]